MKKLQFLFIFLLLFIFVIKTQSTTWVVNVQNYSFSPASISVTVGDTIKWQWLSGSHTTTSTTIPNGAATWDAPLNSSSSTFFYRITVPGTYNYKCTPHELMGMVGSFTASPIGIKQIGNILPKDYQLEQNYPNPFNPSTTIKFDVPIASFIKLIIFDVTGSEIETPVNEQLNAGSYEVNFDASKLSSGVYYYKLAANDYTETKKMILLK